MTITIEAPPWRVGVDVGGTFTDLVVADSEGRTEVFTAVGAGRSRRGRD